ncbi:SIR2 family protein [Providencia hangzhouensis]|uniref:P-loop NTPase n=1 Tax=Providencia hangzhouensis TaxID=3031799 RepID=UPI003F197702
MIYIENKETLEEYFKTGINLFLGSAFSIEASSYLDGKLKKLPTGSELLDEIKVKFKKEKTKLDLPKLCQIISSTDKSELDSFFRSRFKIHTFDKRYSEIQKINIKSIFTTNIDDFVQNIYKNNKSNYLNDISLRGASIKSDSSIDFIALHGSILHDHNEGFDFTPLEISSSFERDKDKWYQYRINIYDYPTVYWGYSLSDSSVLQAIYKDGRSKIGRESWIVIRSDDDDDAKDYFKSLGFNLIISDTSKMLDYISQYKGETQTQTQTQTLINNEKFKEYKLPNHGDYLLRKREDFYLGEEPLWVDIYSGHIHKTEYFYKIKNSILSKKNVMMIGGVLTGKTTLLKQLSYEFNSTKSCLYIREITPEKAKSLKKYISEENGDFILFFDNAADSWESIITLSKLSNVIVVCAERDYIYDSLSHRFDNRVFSIFDISGISKKDQQSIVESIPYKTKKRDGKKREKLKIKDVEPTIYDILKENGVDKIITNRFLNAISELRIENRIKYNLLLLSCYSYNCRIPVSFDMAMSFISSGDYSSILKSLESMSSLISDYNGELGDDLQMYFTPRSRVAAEEILKKLNQDELKLFLETFHENISTTNIIRYDIFKRFAFDANITSRAFSNFEDGQNFYKKYSYKDKSYSYYQQAALYCLRRHKYPESFDWIDQALTIAKGHAIQTVKNTYAVILFSANYKLFLDKKQSISEIIKSLDESMSILIECYNADIKKTYHAKVFADQSIKYYEAVNDSSKSREYILTAMDWINSELARVPGKRNFNSILKSLSIINGKFK